MGLFGFFKRKSGNGVVQTMLENKPIANVSAQAVHGKLHTADKLYEQEMAFVADDQLQAFQCYLSFAEMDHNDAIHKVGFSHLYKGKRAKYDRY